MTFAILFESVGAGEWLVLLAVLLVVVGPKRLPSTVRKFGQYYAKFRRAAEGFKRQLMDMDTEISNAVREAEQEVENAAKDVDPDLTSPDPSEYGGYENYADYGGEPPAEAENEPPKPAEPEKPAAPEPKPAPMPQPKNGIKITVSPAPASTDTSKTES